ncbi:hypothetical protein [Hydrotalea sp.]|uniref:hypothetical protein n=1 Tax=Hydrotalea sp. TaxID=2881279 RepID=UPI0026204E3A|nr:hypothetical protein [Hydrotalea sp.]
MIFEDKIEKGCKIEKYSLQKVLFSSYLGRSDSETEEKSKLFRKRKRGTTNGLTTFTAFECVDWYLVTRVNGVVINSMYVFTTCTSNALYDVPDNNSAGGGDTIIDDIIIPDSTILNNPIIRCVYDQLYNSCLKNILANFSNSTAYSLTFTVGALPNDGNTKYLGNNSFLITINGNDAIDPSYSRIWLAATFIHESFHAKLRQKALEIFGEADILTWPKHIDDMTLKELTSYIELHAKDKSLWNNIMHDWMVNNIDEMASSLRTYVQSYYKTTFANVGNDLEPYRALMYMGLQNSTFYNEKVINTGKEALYNNFRSQFVIVTCTN